MSKKCLNRLGDIAEASNGMLMEIIEYRTCRDMDIQFEDGTIVKGVTYGNFIRGSVSYKGKRVSKPKVSRIGEVSKAHNGMLMEIVGYRTCMDLDVQFEDGTIINHVRYETFKKGLVRNPNIKGKTSKNYSLAMSNTRNLHVGEIKTANNGMKMEIIEYFNYTKVTVKFEDGTIVKNRYYHNFKKGCIANPNIPRKLGVSYEKG